MSPFRPRYFPSLCQNVPLTHGPLSIAYDLSNADPLGHTHTHMHTHRSTVCRCITLHSLRHTVHIYSFNTISTLCERSSIPSASTPSAPGLDCSMYQRFTLLHIKLSSQHSSSHSIRTTHKTHKYHRNNITASLKHSPFVLL